MGYKETMAWKWERLRDRLENKSTTYIPVKAQESNDLFEAPVTNVAFMRKQGIQFLCSWSKDKPNTCNQPAIRLYQDDALCNYHFLAKIGVLKEANNSSVDNIKQAEEFKKRLDRLRGSKENKLALDMARYALLHRAVWNLKNDEEVPSLDEVASGEVKIHNIGFGKRMALKEALEIENKNAI
jgi:hypothetical protein